MTAAAGARCPACGQTYPRAGYCANDGTRLVEIQAAPVAAESLLGRALDDRYRIDSIAGLGGMATVYRGLQLSIDREVIIKVIHPHVVRDPDVARRLLAVGRLACQITAPAIANTFDFGQTSDGLVYLVMELVRGRTLAQEINGHALAYRRVVAIGIQILDALESAQRHGLVHGCLTPNNIMLADDSSRRDVVKVVDFGLAPPPNTADEVKLARYRAPELFAGQPADARSDLYALGCVLYEALGGTPPFNDLSVDILRNRHTSAQPPKLPPNVPAPLVAVVETLLAKSPDARYRFFADARRALEPMHVSSSAPVTGLPAPARVVGKGEITALTQPPGMPPATYAAPVPPMPQLPQMPQMPQLPPMPPPPREAARASSRGLVIAIVALVAIALGVAIVMLAS